MARTPQYQKILNELEAGELTEIERKILDALLKAPNGLTRQGLIRIVFDVEPQRNLANDPYDRKIRKGIESLRNRMIPIVSSSGEAGYRLDTDPAKKKPQPSFPLTTLRNGQGMVDEAGTVSCARR